MAGLLANGSVPTTLADTALKHLFKVQMRLGMFDEADAQPPWAKYEHAPCVMLDGSSAHLFSSVRCIPLQVYWSTCSYLIYLRLSLCLHHFR